ncbi:MAG: methyl-accepting chemotaxis protein [Nibricoccus sp.]
MKSSAHTRLTIPKRLILLAGIPLLGLLGLGGIYFHSLYSSYQSFTNDTRVLSTFQNEIRELNVFNEPLQRERDASLEVYAHPGDAIALANYKKLWPATDQAWASLQSKLDQLTASKEKALFAEKVANLRTLFATLLPEARANTEANKSTSGKTFSSYLKLAFGRMLISECYRPMVKTPDGLNLFDAMFTLLKVQQQEILACSLVLHGTKNGGLQRDEIGALRKQFFAITESEYYLRKYHAAIRAFWDDTARKSTDDAPFYVYLTTLAGTQMENTPLPPFVPKTNSSLAGYTNQHLQSFDKVFAFGFDVAQKEIGEIAHGHEVRAIVIGCVMIAGFILTVTVAIVIIRSTKGNLVNVSASIDSASEDVQSASGQLSEAGDRISRDATSYASAIEEIGASLNQLASTAATNRKQAEKAASTTANIKASVDVGLGTIQQLDTAMNSARTSGQKIVQIISRINDISFQTNLLALNAAVEAARAGSAGAGFAVVADEVRQLARRAADAARETEQLISQSSQDTETAISKSDELAKNFKNLSLGIHEVNEIVSLINSSIADQTSGISDINTAVSKQGEIAQSIAAAAEETASTAFSMENQVGSLEQTVAQLEALLGIMKKQSQAESSAQKPEHELQPLSA